MRVYISRQYYGEKGTRMSDTSRWILAAILCVIAAGPMYAQSDRGTITGVVRDSTGLPVPATEVRILNEATGIPSSTVASESGNYTLAILPIGSYTITVQHAGFKTYVRSQVPVQV